MSEFQIDRAAKEPPPKLGLDSSSETDADGGGGTSFVFYGDGGEGKKEQRKENRPPAPIGPAVELALSSVASVDVGNEPVPGDFGRIGGLVTPPESLSPTIEKVLEKAKELDAVDPLVPVTDAVPGSVINIKA